VIVSLSFGLEIEMVSGVTEGVGVGRPSFVTEGFDKGKK
jgi:hypothetical protein